MSISEYFDAAEGHGVLATADGNGRVDAAIYARPHMVDENTVAFIMADRLTHRNLQSNPHAAYLFFQKGSNFTGVRLFLTKIKEETHKEKLEAVRRKSYPELNDGEEYLVSFNIDEVLPLVGPE